MSSMPALLTVVTVGLYQGLHEFVYHGPGSPRSWIVVESYLKWVCCYGIGAIFFATRFPESYFPGQFDFVGHSHMLWHLCVAAGAFIQYDIVHIYRANTAAVC